MGTSPKYIERGINDLSLLPQVIAKAEYGQHLTKWFVRTAKGTYNREILSGPEVIAKYGAQSFTKDGGFRNHQTVFLEGAMSTSKVITQRIDMGGSGAKLTHYIDIATKTETILKRTPSGAIDLTAGDLAVDVAGLKIKHLVMNDGNPVIQEGTMVNADGSPSTMYPILDYTTEDGAYYNNLGYNLKPLNTDKKEVLDNKQFLYEFTFRETIDGFQGVRNTISGSPTAKLGLLDTLSPLTNITINFKDVIETAYSNTTNRARGWVYPDFNIAVNTGNIELILKRIEASEKAFITDLAVSHVDTEGGIVDYADWFEVGDEDFNEYSYKMYNLMDGKSMNKVPYMTVTMDDTTSGVVSKIVTNSDSVFKFAGGTDKLSTFADAEAETEYYNAQVRGFLAGYADPDSELMETAFSPESVLYDSGWDVATKEAMINFISLRKDTGIHMSSYIVNDAGDRVMTVEEEVAITKLIKGRLLLAPESTYFNTKVARASISFGSCTIVDNTHRGRVPTTYDLMMKIGGLMGAGTKKWVRNKQFDAGDVSAANLIEDILPRTLPRSIKDEIWNTGVNYLEPLYTDETYHWTAFSTVSDDVSGLNNIMVMHAAMWCQRIQIFAWKNFTGENRYLEPSFIKQSEQFMTKQLLNAFDGRFLITPTTVFSTEDILYGNMWSTDIELKVNGSYTVVNTSTTVKRK